MNGKNDLPVFNPLKTILRSIKIWRIKCRAFLFRSPTFCLTLLSITLLLPPLLLVLSGFYLSALVSVLLLVPFWRPLSRIVSYLRHSCDSPGLGEYYTDSVFKPDQFYLASQHLLLQLHPANGQITGQIVLGVFANKSLSELTSEDIQWLKSRWEKGSPLCCLLLRLWEEHGQECSLGLVLPEPDLRAAQVLLGVGNGSDRQTINKNFRRLMMGFHPDRGGSDTLARTIFAAKNILLRSAR